MIEVTLRFKVEPEDAAFVKDLVVAWTEKEGVTIITGGGYQFVQLTYVKEQERS